MEVPGIGDGAHSSQRKSSFFSLWRHPKFEQITLFATIPQSFRSSRIEHLAAMFF
jgi:hypothetical protein